MQLYINIYIYVCMFGIHIYIYIMGSILVSMWYSMPIAKNHPTSVASGWFEGLLEIPHLQSPDGSRKVPAWLIFQDCHRPQKKVSMSALSELSPSVNMFFLFSMLQKA